MAQNQKSYDTEFKAQAVKLAQEIGGHKAARELGIPKGTMYTYKAIKKQGGALMGFFDFLKQANINQGIEEYKKTAGAVLLDVRTPQEYQEGHIPESKNVPLQQLNNVVAVVKNTEIPLFVYCYSGARSRQATGMLQRMGYSKVNNIGGIAAYSGKVEN